MGREGSEYDMVRMKECVILNHRLKSLFVRRSLAMKRKIFRILLSLALVIACNMSMPGTEAYALEGVSITGGYMGMWDVGYTSPSGKNIYIDNNSNEDLRVDHSCWTISNTKDFRIEWKSDKSISPANSSIDFLCLYPKDGQPGGYYETTITFRDKDNKVNLSKVVSYQVYDKNNTLSLYVYSYGYEYNQHEGWVSIGSGSPSTAIGSSNNVLNEKATITASPAKGYQFKEWKWSNKSRSDAIAEGKTVKDNPWDIVLTDNLYAVAYFEPIEESTSHTVTFNANGGSGSMPDMTVADGGWLKFPECTFTPPAGATFAGWKLAYRDSVYDPGNSVTIYQDTIYYAIWKGGSVVSNDFDTHYVNTGALNMRAKPDTGSERIGGLKKGDLVMLLDSDGEWFQISYRGLIGWVQNKYLDRVIGGWEYPFTDITEGTFDYVPILWAYNAKPQVTNGITSTRFGPKETVTRGQCVTFLWRAMGEPEPKSKYNPFVDVPESQYYYKPILWAVEKGITKGTDKNHFSPDQKLSTAHIITFLYRALGKGSDGWYQKAGNWASSNGLLDRTGLTVSPSVDCPRGAVVTFLYRTK